MRILVIADIHGNIEALRTVLQDAGQIDAAWCLGDLTGYGPHPNKVIESIMELPNLICLSGNHDVALRNEISLSDFNVEARESLDYQRSLLNEKSLRFLHSIASQSIVEVKIAGRAAPLSVNLTHGSPRDPTWEYIYTNSSASEILEQVKEDIVLVGHSHYQFYALEDADHYLEIHLGHVDRPIELTGRGMFNPGSVGQPRDRDPRAAYAILDTDQNTWTPFRVDYDIDKVADDLYERGLPAKNGNRLYRGI